MYVEYTPERGPFSLFRETIEVGTDYAKRYIEADAQTRVALFPAVLPDPLPARAEVDSGGKGAET